MKQNKPTMGNATQIEAMESKTKPHNIINKIIISKILPYAMSG